MLHALASMNPNHVYDENDRFSYKYCDVVYLIHYFVYYIIFYMQIFTKNYAVKARSSMRTN